MSPTHFDSPMNRVQRRATCRMARFDWLFADRGGGGHHHLLRPARPARVTAEKNAIFREKTSSGGRNTIARKPLTPSTSRVRLSYFRAPIPLRCSISSEGFCLPYPLPQRHGLGFHVGNAIFCLLSLGFESGNVLEQSRSRSVPFILKSTQGQRKRERYEDGV